MKKNKNFSHLAQTSDNPLAFEVEKAEGIYFYDKKGNKYIDLISGISVNNMGHRRTAVINAIKEQLDKYLHVMAYGEFVEKPQKDYAALLAGYLPATLNSVYFVNSGAEAIEGALKLAKRYTGRSEILSFIDSYYGGTHGALSITGSFEFKRAFRPLLPDVRHIRFNKEEDLEHITDKTACVVVECVQGEAGVVVAEKGYLQKLRKRCNDTGTLLVIDEVQTAFGRTGKLFAFEYYDIIPDILVLAKALGGGMPLGAFIASEEIMHSLSREPVLGHITTFGGHPVSCAAGMAALKLLNKSKVFLTAPGKHILFKKNLKHKKIKEIRGKGLMMALRFESPEICNKVIANCFKNKLITDSFVFAEDCLRISPPLIISEKQILDACEIILKSIQ
ncbi:MAG: aspartate aminotransferase family protein [Bacteroidales bacterium]|nr:aspartate aminotransferase family protein [Bacteroidales bacterium]